jgi:L-asparagine transporter-like permease
MNKISIRKYTFQLIVFSVVLTILGIIFQLVFPQYASPAIPYIVLFFFAITLSSLYIVLRKPNKVSGKKFIAGYMLSRIVKFLSILIFLILYIIFNSEDRLKFAVAFLVIYFACSIFEIIALKKEQ